MTNPQFLMSSPITQPKEAELSLKIARSSTYLPGYDVILACNDSLAFLKSVPSESAGLIVSSPPYNMGKEYEHKLTRKEYTHYQYRVLKECKRILKADGSICWQVGNYVENGEVLPLDIIFYEILREKLGLKLRNRIVWRFEHGLHASKRLSGRYEVILWFTKEGKYHFDLDSLRVPQKYPGKRYSKGPRRGEVSGNPLGKNPGDFWDILAHDWDSLIWDIPNVKWNHPEKTSHPAQFPIELVERLVLALSKQGDLIIDPFMGTASSLIAAALHGRKAAGVDYNESYLQIGYERIKALGSGELKRRPIGTTKYQPNGKEKVAQRPEEWSSLNQNDL